MNDKPLPPWDKVDALLLLGPAGQTTTTEAAYQTFLPPLADRLGLPAAACRLAFRETAALEAIHDFTTAARRRIVVLPLTLQPEEHQHEAIYGNLDWIRVRTPQLELRYAPGLSAQPALIDALADRAAASLAGRDNHLPYPETAILLIGRGGHNPENNAEIARIARLLYEGRTYGWVETAYYRQSQPQIGAGLQRCLQLGARQIVVIPYGLYLGRSAHYIAAQVSAFQAEHPGAPVILAAELADHPAVIEALAQQVMATASGQPGAPRQQGHSHDHTHGRQLLAAPDFLPPRYRNGGAVSAAPMGAAPLVYDGEGRVAWDQVWGKDPSASSGQAPNSPFCELALAGGPPHRGELLEPVPPDLVKADWAGYSRVVAELTRGIQMTTGLRTRLSQAFGWIGVECHSETMAIWLLRAILVENISVRREKELLYLPAGPNFRLEYEIKNVITALAKTHHYWQEHLCG